MYWIFCIEFQFVTTRASVTQFSYALCQMKASPDWRSHEYFMQMGYKAGVATRVWNSWKWCFRIGKRLNFAWKCEELEQNDKQPIATWSGCPLGRCSVLHVGGNQPSEKNMFEVTFLVILAARSSSEHRFPTVEPNRSHFLFRRGVKTDKMRADRPYVQ